MRQEDGEFSRDKKKQREQRNGEFGGDQRSSETRGTESSVEIRGLSLLRKALSKLHDMLNIYLNKHL